MTSAPPGEAQRIQANIRKLSLLSASHMFLVVMPVIVPFYRAHGLDMREVYRCSPSSPSRHSCWMFPPDTQRTC